ncbi:helitron_like_N domain-containing protein [Trichonephila clavipes]|nr:helitron_like_N domain-containing protein [Trichonephila clavipes]
MRTFFCNNRKPVSEGMPDIIQLVTDLCSVSRDDLPGNQYNNQVHRHTLTCTKRGETILSFNIPYWPISETLVLLPLSKDDRRCSGFQLNCEDENNTNIWTKTMIQCSEVRSTELESICLADFVACSPEAMKGLLSIDFATLQSQSNNYVKNHNYLTLNYTMGLKWHQVLTKMSATSMITYYYCGSIIPQDRSLVFMQLQHDVTAHLPK